LPVNLRRLARQPPCQTEEQYGHARPPPWQPLVFDDARRLEDDRRVPVMELGSNQLAGRLEAHDRVERPSDGVTQGRLPRQEMPPAEARRDVQSDADGIARRDEEWRGR